MNMAKHILSNRGEILHEKISINEDRNDSIRSLKTLTKCWNPSTQSESCKNKVLMIQPQIINLK